MFISYCSPVQGRKAHANTGDYEFNSMVIGQYVYKHAWTLFIDECVSTSMWENNKRDESAVNDQL